MHLHEKVRRVVVEWFMVENAGTMASQLLQGRHGNVHVLRRGTPPNDLLHMALPYTMARNVATLHLHKKETKLALSTVK